MDLRNPTRRGGIITRSAFQFRWTPQAHFYSYIVSVVVVDEAMYDWAKKGDGEDDGEKFRRDMICREMVRKLFECTLDFFEQPVYAYDGRRCLYTPSPLPSAVLKEHVLEADVMSEAAVNALLRDPVRVCIKPHHNGQPVFMASARPLHKDSRLLERTPLAEFLDCVSSDRMGNNHIYVSCRGGKLYETHEEDLMDGLVLRGGILKAVRVPDATNGSSAPEYVAEVRNQAFYKEETLAKLFYAFRESRSGCSDDACYDAFLELYRGVRCGATFGLEGMFTLKEEYGPPTKDIIVLAEMPFVDYMRKYCNVPNPDGKLRTVHVVEFDFDYPMELLKVLPNQRVLLANMSLRLQEALLEANRLSVSSDAELRRHLDVILGSGSRALMSGFGVAIDYPPRP